MTLATTDFAAGALPRHVRAVLRADDDFLVRKIDLVGGVLMGGDFLRAYIWNAICVLNVRHLTRSDATFVYAALHDFPPDRERRPIAARALATALRLPYETVRRQALRLERDGHCARVPGKGFVVPTRIFELPHVLETARRVFALVQRYLAEARRAGFDSGEIGRSPRPGAPDPASVARAAIRLDSEYSMDVIAIVRRAHDDDPIEALLVRAIAAENLRHLPPRAFGGAGEVAPDALRRPVSILAMSGSTNIPYETLRRAINRMAGAGLLARGRDGFIMPAAVQRRIEDEAMLRQRYERLKRFIADLQYVGLQMRQ